MPTTKGFSRVLAGALASTVWLAGSAAAQTPTPPPAPRNGVQPFVMVGVRFDDNVFSRSKTAATADSILRVTPGVIAVRTRPTLTLSASYMLDAERYQDHPNLTTPQARQTGSLTMTLRPDARTAVVLRSGYFRTLDASELNQTSGLTTIRARAQRWQVGAGLRRTLTPRVTMEMGYDFSHDAIVLRDATQTHMVDGRFTRLFSQHAAVYGRVTVRRFDFGSAAAMSTLFTAAGWSLTTNVLHVSVEAGPQQLSGAGASTTIGPAVEASIGRQVDVADITLSYGRGQTTALGLSNAIRSDHLQVATVWRRRGPLPGPGQGPQAAQLTLRGGFYRNQLGATSTRTYQFSAEFLKGLTSRMAILLGYDTSAQNGQLGAGGTAPGGIRRNQITVSLSVSPWKVR
jgi:opacity protein-like surface antigen